MVDDVGELLIYALDQLGPICDGANHVPAEDEVVLSVFQPRAFNIVDLEFYVGRNPEMSSLSPGIFCAKRK